LSAGLSFQHLTQFKQKSADNPFDQAAIKRVPERATCMFDYSCLFRYGDNHIGSSGLVYFHTVDEFDAWFRTSNQIRWAILAMTETGEVISSLSRPAVKFGQ
jgi:hypothetical protein